MKMTDFLAELTWRGMVHDIMPGTEEVLIKENVRLAILGLIQQQILYT